MNVVPGHSLLSSNYDCRKMVLEIFSVQPKFLIVQLQREGMSEGKNLTIGIILQDWNTCRHRNSLNLILQSCKKRFENDFSHDFLKSMLE